MAIAFNGMRGSGSWSTDERPKNYRESILFLYPNGKAPLTGLLSKMGSEKVDDPEFNWWTQALTEQRGTVTGIYTNSTLATAYVSGGAAAAVLYVKMAQAEAQEFRAGHQVLLRDASDYTVDVNAKVTAVTLAGASSYLTVKLLEADDNSSIGDLSDCDTCLVIGNINPEGGLMPDSISYDPVKWYNYTQIFRTPLSITRTAAKTRLRTKDARKNAKREALEIHSIEIEKAFLFGIRTENVGSNGMPERTTGGLVTAIKSSGTLGDYVIDKTATTTWVAGGEDWLNGKLEQIFRYGSGDKLAFVGSGVLLGIQALVKAGVTYTFNRETIYGYNVTQWVTPFGTINLMTHPLFSFEPTNRFSMMIFEPNGLKYRFIDDTDFYGDGDKQNTGAGRKDGFDEEFLTEAGLEYHHPMAWGYLNNVGVDAP